jgi:hypothetical protein
MTINMINSAKTQLEQFQGLSQSRIVSGTSNNLIDGDVEKGERRRHDVGKFPLSGLDIIISFWGSL